MSPTLSSFINRIKHNILDQIVIILSMQDLDTEIVIATAKEGRGGSTAVAANIVVDERQMNKLFLDVVSVTSIVFS